MDSRGRFHRRQEEEIKTETFLDSLVRRMTVYAVALIGLFLIIKEFLLGTFIVCQPINRSVRINISYSHSEADYDKAYCSLSMTDFRENLIRATGGEPNAIPGVTIMGIKPGEGRVLYQNLLPFAFIIQAALCSIPSLLWRTWASEILCASVRFIMDISERFPRAPIGEFAPRDRRKEQSYEVLSEGLSSQVDFWGGRKFLARVYTTKLMLNLGVLIFIVCFYLSYPVLNYYSLQALFVCHVNRQTLVTCIFPDIGLFKVTWIANIVLVDISIVLIVFQLINVAFCMSRTRTFFVWYLGVEERNKTRLPNDMHLISHFCYANLSAMCPRIVLHSDIQRTALYNPLISLGSSQEELNTSSSSSSLSYNTAPQVFRRQTATELDRE